jgi:hypothetical protein
MRERQSTQFNRYEFYERQILFVPKRDLFELKIIDRKRNSIEESKKHLI